MELFDVNCILIYLILFLVFYSVVVFFLIYRRLKFKNELRSKFNLISDFKLCAFFHPYCLSGGGGERVLWEAIKAIQLEYPNVFCVIYCQRLSLSNDEIFGNVLSVFGIRVEKPVYFVHLDWTKLLLPSLYKRITLIGQSFGSIIVGLESIWKCVPDVYVDTTGFAFTLLVFKCMALCRTAAYIHYPTISSDMIASVVNREVAVNNKQSITSSWFKSTIKLWYYRFFAVLYGFVGGTCTNCVMVNSSWTQRHIKTIWWNVLPKIVYPPCDLMRSTSGVVQPVRKPWIISVGQFRIEKNHQLQIKAFKYYMDHFFQNLHETFDKNDVKLILIGGCRNADDLQRVEDLKLLVAELQLSDRVKFACNVSYSDIVNYYHTALIGLHTMSNEHFGIAVVESMAAGLVTVAHNSAGPKLDIIDNGLNGFLAITEQQYAESFDKVLRMHSEHWDILRLDAQLKTNMFSSDNFSRNFVKSTELILL